MNIRATLFGTAVVAALIAAPSVSYAQGTPEQRSACMGDAFRLCSSQIPNVAKITACMKSNFSKLSPGCKTVFVKG
jgi:hypothetical protein